MLTRYKCGEVHLHSLVEYTFDMAKIPYKSKRTFLKKRKPVAKKAKPAGQNLEKVVDAKVKRAIKEASRGPPRSIPVKLLPGSFDRATSKYVVEDLFRAYVEGPSAGRSYAILPVSELVPAQRPKDSDADDRYRSFDKVHIKGVSLRMSVNHAEGVRLMAFAFRNPVRRDTEPCISHRPFSDVAGLPGNISKNQVTTEVVYDVMDKNSLMGLEPRIGSIPNVPVHDGPFKVVRNSSGKYGWKSTDGSAFTSRFNTGEGRPIGQVFAAVDGGRQKKCGSMFKSIFNASSLMRTVGFDRQDEQVKGWVSTRTRQVELYFKLDVKEKFTFSNSSVPVSERPIEIFLGFDSPMPYGGNSSKNDIVSGALIGMDAEVYYSSI